MFSNLVESGSHAADLKRRGTFFAGTLAFYGLLLVTAGVGSIYAYNATLGDDSGELEILAVMKFQPEREVRQEQRQSVAPRRAATSPSGGGPGRAIQVKELSAQNPNLSDRPFASESTPVMRKGFQYEVGPANVVPTGLGGYGGPGTPGTGDGDGVTGKPAVSDGGEAPGLVRPTPAPQKPKGPIPLSSQVITGKTLEKPAPPYPPLAKQMGVQGPVSVQIVVDESGRVIAAKATSGHPLLQAAAQQAAYRARFTPTFLTGQPVKVSGVITYNFVLK